MKWLKRADAEEAPVAPVPPTGGLPRLLQSLPTQSRDQLRALLGTAEIPKGVWWRLQLCVTPRFYDAQLLPPERPEDWGDTPTVAQAVGHFLAVGSAAGHRVTVWFNPAWYARELTRMGEPTPPDGEAFWHWLTWGWDHKVVATPLFDEDFYRESHPALAADYEHWLFRHFLTRGAYGPTYQANPIGKFHEAREAVDDETRDPLILDTVLRHAEEYDLGRSSWLEHRVLQMLDKRAALTSPVALEMIAKAAAIEPAVVTGPALERSMAWPLHWHPLDLLLERAEAVRTALPRTSYAAVVLVSDLSDSTWGPRAKGVADALQVDPDESDVLVLALASTGAVALEPDEVDVTRHLDGLTAEQRVSIVRDVLVGTGPARIVNAGSTIGWDVYAAYARQLSTRATLVGWLTDEAPDSPEVGSLPTWADHLGLTLAPDAETVATLVHRFVLPAGVRERLVVAPAEHSGVAELVRALDGPRQEAVVR